MTISGLSHVTSKSVYQKHAFNMTYDQLCLTLTLCRQVHQIESKQGIAEFHTLHEEINTLAQGKIPEKMSDWRITSTSLAKDPSLTEYSNHHLLLANLLCSTVHFVYYTPIDVPTAINFQNFCRVGKFSRILEVGSGRGWWAKALHSDKDFFFRRLHITATDKGCEIDCSRQPNPMERYLKYNAQLTENHCQLKSKQILPKETVHPVEELDAAEAIAKYANNHDLLLVTSPVIGMWETLCKWPKKKPILIVSTLNSLERSKEVSEKMGFTYEKVTNIPLPEYPAGTHIPPYSVNIMLIKNLRIVVKNEVE